MLTQSTWQHITVTWSSDTGLYGYVNGNLVFSSTSAARNKDRKAGGVLVLGQVGRLRYIALKLNMLIEFQLKFIDVYNIVSSRRSPVIFIVYYQVQDSRGAGFDSTQAFAGYLYELNWLRVQLSSDEIRKIYNSGFTLFPSSLLSESVLKWEDVLNHPRHGNVRIVHGKCLVIVW